ncbi:DeoR/GlpR family DNA-binding transcription regulator [Mycoplasma mycoides subsp. mycoides]|uniref:Sucrose PTS repressor, DeoR family n=2 Tax=Mycoplasma mycoides subsp. mycoides TaxID=2103 RepID=Q6MSX2_MYCMS|nr:DeoR/GlpR family DNA-binding transcription regulator [Mycoplasma mycoides]QQY77957.1 DeoR/GlpR transcriptional regulator [Mycoplasma mycoides subsp. capri]CAE77266.1 Sucrose PTS repressor, DeoR family [Mycoplasma mycoides subsp. mycoides SC str. PG1]ADK69552.1 transcriptional regulator, DeoR family [Mycoplasma mycoides subsp. mycoides SC str. Gladysdale]AIZ55502.1 DeoR family transcriptional regulator [Mycoplasma mycoides subsp. mycoides]AME10847.1 DeoR family sucrose PTS repressor [Mycopla
MLKDQRRQKILEIVNEKDFVTNRQLAKLLSSTIQTIISDISELDKGKKLYKVYGGAKSANSLAKRYELFDEEKQHINIDIKDLIAQKASEYVSNGDLIFLDTGTTTKQMIKYLINKKIIVVTNGYSIALKLVEQDIEVILLGGSINPSTHATIGELALKNLDNFYFDKVFIGMNNLSSQHFYTTNIKEALIKEKAIKNSDKSFILMDSSKFGSKNVIKVDVLKETILISDKDTDEYKGLIINLE